MRLDTLDCYYSAEIDEVIYCNCDFPYCVLPVLRSRSVPDAKSQCAMRGGL